MSTATGGAATRAPGSRAGAGGASGAGSLRRADARGEGDSYKGGKAVTVAGGQAGEGKQTGDREALGERPVNVNGRNRRRAHEEAQRGPQGRILPNANKQAD